MEPTMLVVAAVLTATVATWPANSPSITKPLLATNVISLPLSLSNKLNMFLPTLGLFI